MANQKLYRGTIDGVSIAITQAEYEAAILAGRRATIGEAVGTRCDDSTPKELSNRQRKRIEWYEMRHKSRKHNTNNDL